MGTNGQKTAHNQDHTGLSSHSVPRNIRSSSLSHFTYEGGGIIFLRNIGVCPQNYMASQPRNPQFICLCIYSSFNDTLSISDCRPVASKNWMVVISALEKTRKEAVGS
jgi:hypothetical protein